MTWLQISALVIYMIICMGMSFYGFHYYILLVLFSIRQRRQRKSLHKEITFFNDGISDDAFPMVTIQLPLYNEPDVIERLLSSAASVDYPRSRLEIQVLDDSTDQTMSEVDRVAENLRLDGFNVSVFRRDSRKDFKAGALAEGTKAARGEYLAIFDADFIIPENFLKRTIALIDPFPDVACVQTRWGHTNRRQNMLTRGVSLGIDGHFGIEQGARCYNGLYMNFNGTAGVWRKEAIEAGGGWSGQTLTEDLDLSYRVQLAGYRMRYDLDLESPAEIPSTLLAFKTQQHRWAKGSIETAIKLLPRILKDKTVSLAHKGESILHMTHYLVSLFMLLHVLFTLPFLSIVPVKDFGPFAIPVWAFIILSSCAPFFMYLGSGLTVGRPIKSLVYFPLLLVIGAGICINNSIAVIEAILGIRSEFVRTPKSGSTDKISKKSCYSGTSGLTLGIIELILGCYSFVTIGFYISRSINPFIILQVSYAIGFLGFGIMTIIETIHKVRRRRIQVEQAG
jgi:cellulose synthase/poly-beta-1,6-N-acetylglucosamine synthase-like glycosyltransferase